MREKRKAEISETWKNNQNRRAYFTPKDLKITDNNHIASILYQN
jgi:hypothetical protein